MTEQKNSLKPIAIVAIIISSTIPLSIYGLLNHEFVLNFEHMIYLMFEFTAEFLNIIGAFLIVFGSVLLVSRYVSAKLKDPNVPFNGATPRLTFLTLGLEIFIGAEIINSAITRTVDDFILLGLTIGVRAVIGFVLHFEKKWCSHEE